MTETTDTDRHTQPGTGARAVPGTAAVRDALTIPALYQGYPGVAYGGYVAGLLADRAAADTVRVDFRAATPVEAPLHLTGLADGTVRLADTSGTVLATATPTPALSADAAPAAPTLAQARAASEAFRAAELVGRAADGTPLDCFGCGHRTPDRGLRQHCTRVPGRDVVAAAWTPHPAFAGERGSLRTEMLWAALDCATAWAGIHLGALRTGAVTASLTATLLRPAATGEDHITYAWPTARSGRKHTMGVAVTTATGEPCVVGEALWIDPRT